MRLTTIITLALSLAAGASLLAQEAEDADQADAGSTSAEAAPPVETGVSFSPSEDVAADTAVAFPTDI